MLKVRDPLFTSELFVALFVFILGWIGMSTSIAGLMQIPKCKHGAEDCFFFVQICGKGDPSGPFDGNTTQCMWMPKNRRVAQNEGPDSLDRFKIPLLAAILGVVPGIGMVAAATLKNQRTMFGILELAKYFIGFNCILLVISTMMVDELTFACRWYSSFWHPDVDGCKMGFTKHTAGSALIFTTEFLLLSYTIIFGEMERKRISDGPPLDITGTGVQAMDMRSMSMGNRASAPGGFGSDTF